MDEEAQAHSALRSPQPSSQPATDQVNRQCCQSRMLKLTLNLSFGSFNHPTNIYRAAITHWALVQGLRTQ